jgi:hypothetical protein
MKELAMDLHASGWASRSFGGSTYEPERDGERLSGQLQAVYRLMSDGEWRTLAEIKERVGGTDASVSARLRDLRKANFGSHVVDRRYVANGLYEYRLQTRSNAA